MPRDHLPSCDRAHDSFASCLRDPHLGVRFHPDTLVFYSQGTLFSARRAPQMTTGPAQEPPGQLRAGISVVIPAPSTPLLSLGWLRRDAGRGEGGEARRGAAQLCC